MNVSTRDVGCAVHEAMVLNPSSCFHGLLAQWEAMEWLLPEKSVLLCTFLQFFSQILISVRNLAPNSFSSITEVFLRILTME